MFSISLDPREYTSISQLSTMQQVVSPQVVKNAILNVLQNQSCTDFHPGMSCNHKAFSQFIIGSKSVSKMYLMVHLIPFLIFKRKQAKQSPLKQVTKLLVGFIKSLLFAGGYTALIRRFVCLVTQTHKFVGYSNLIAAVLSSITLTFEPISRQSEIALYTLNKSIEVVYNMGRRRSMPVRIAGGECLLVGVACAIICFCFLECPQAIRGSYLSILNKLLKDC